MTNLAFHNRVFVTFSDKSSGKYPIYVLQGACIIGEPTAYVERNGQRVFVKPIAAETYVEV